MNDRDRRNGFDLARMLAILGGLVIIVSGAFSIISPFLSRRGLPDVDAILTIATYGFLVVVLGFVAVVGSRHVNSLGWDVVLIGLGLLAYHYGAGLFYSIGPILAVVAGIVGIAVKLA